MLSFWQRISLGVLMQIGLNKGSVEVTTSLGLVDWVLEQKAFCLSPSRPIGPKETSLGPMNDREVAIYAAKRLVLIESEGVGASLRKDALPEEERVALYWKLRTLGTWELGLENLLRKALCDHFAEQIPRKITSFMGVRDGFQVVLYTARMVQRGCVVHLAH